jgi:hypothetical protein
LSDLTLIVRSSVYRSIVHLAPLERARFAPCTFGMVVTTN